MRELRVHNFSISLDGFDDAATDVDRRFRARGEEDVGATVMGRTMFGPVREDWGTSQWAG